DPSGSRCFLSNLRATIFAQFFRPRFPTLQPALAGVLFPRLKRIVLNLARGDLHHADGVADRVSGALLALRSFGHVRIIAQSDRGRTDFSRGQILKLRHYQQPGAIAPAKGSQV
ncbi:MAG: hypothetical protein ABSD51_09720, partial [Candidatus Binatus sp.]